MIDVDGLAKSLECPVVPIVASRNQGIKELKEAINWVNTHRMESARLSFDMMRQPVDSIELFLSRVKFDYVDGEELIKKVKDYFEILLKEGIVDLELDEEFLNIFRL